MIEATLRTPTERLAFCDAYFDAVNANLIRQSDGYREYELPRDVDKEMTDRPYYWMWVEKTNQEVPPSILRLAFTDEVLKRENERLRKEAWEQAEKQGMNDIQRMYFRAPTAEFVTLGSFRLDKICQSLAQRGQFAVVQPASVPNGAPLIPWLMVNLRVSRRCDLVEQTFLSVGVCLKNHQVVERFYEMIHRIEMVPMHNVPEVSTTALQEGFARVQKHVTAELHRSSHDWAKEAQVRMEAELQQVRTYYQSILPDTSPAEHPLILAECARKEAELQERTQPRIEIQLMQAALVGLIER